MEAVLGEEITVEWGMGWRAHSRRNPAEDWTQRGMESSPGRRKLMWPEWMAQSGLGGEETGKESDHTDKGVSP